MPTLSDASIALLDIREALPFIQGTVIFTSFWSFSIDTASFRPQFDPSWDDLKTNADSDSPWLSIQDVVAPSMCDNKRFLIVLTSSKGSPIYMHCHCLSRLSSLLGKACHLLSRSSVFFLSKILFLAYQQVLVLVVPPIAPIKCLHEGSCWLLLRHNKRLYPRQPFWDHS